MTANGLLIAPAETSDLVTIKKMLDAASLPVAGVDEHVATFLVARESGQLVGAIGLELYGETALLRSAVVVPERRNSGIGSMLCDGLIRQARDRGVRKLVLLTNTAKDYFARKGFRTIDRAEVQGPVTTSVEFTDACPSHAYCMELDL
jgi:N-acetylglutamate synthase-like GNAT family acetyltransferase